MPTDRLEDQDRHVLVVNTWQRQIIVLEAEEYRIGRSPSNEIVLPYNTVSRHHATLIQIICPQENRPRYQLKDGDAKTKGSINGVFVNGKRTDLRQLKHGDKISFGQVIEAAYMHLKLDDDRFSSFLTSLSDAPQIESIRVAEHLSIVEPTSIMLGGNPNDDSLASMSNPDLKETLSNSTEEKLHYRH